MSSFPVVIPDSDMFKVLDITNEQEQELIKIRKKYDQDSDNLIKRYSELVILWDKKLAAKIEKMELQNDSAFYNAKLAEEKEAKSSEEAKQLFRDGEVAYFKNE